MDILHMHQNRFSMQQMWSKNFLEIVKQVLPVLGYFQELGTS